MGRFPTTMVYRVSVASVDLRFGRILMDVSMFSGTSSIASGQFWCYMRRSLPEVEVIDSTGVRPDSLAGGLQYSSARVEDWARR